MPPVSNREANASTYASTTHCSSEKPAFKSCWIRGSATLKTVLSSIAIARAKHIVSRTTTFSRAFSPSNPSMDPPRRPIRTLTRTATGFFPIRQAYPGLRTSPGARQPRPILGEPVLELLDLHRRFRDVVALDGVSFTVPEGRIVGFVGRNGAGKTTPIRCAWGVLDADQGQVRWRDAPVDTAARRRFGYMPEERGLYPKMRVLEQLVYLARLRGTSKAEARANAERLLATLEVVGDPDARVESSRSATSSVSSSPPPSSTGPSCWSWTSRSPDSILSVSMSCPGCSGAPRATRARRWCSRAISSTWWSVSATRSC